MIYPITIFVFFFFFFNDTATTEIYTLSLHDALPISLEVGRVQVDALDHAAPAEAQHYPVMTGAPPAPRLPAVAHVAGRSRHDQVQWLAEELIARGERHAAVLHRDEIDGGPLPRRFSPGPARPPPKAQPRHP